MSGKTRWYSQRRLPGKVSANAPSLMEAERELLASAEGYRQVRRMKDYFEVMAEVGRIREKQKAARE